MGKKRMGKVIPALVRVGSQSVSLGQREIKEAKVGKVERVPNSVPT